MNAEFFSALDDLEREKGIPKAYMREKISQALIAAFKRDNKDSQHTAENVLVDWDEKNYKIRMYISREVVSFDDMEDETTQIKLSDAREIDPKYELGDVVNVEIDASKFGRIAAQTAKQVIIQGIREAERGMIFSEFQSKEHEIIPGVVTRVDPRGGAFISAKGPDDQNEILLTAAEQIPGEKIHEGDHIKVYVAEVRRAVKGPQVMISRSHPGLVKRLFELEVPEIADGLVEVRAVAREAGSRTKLAVASTDPDIDPVGACIGPRGSRVGNVLSEIKGEKVDVVKFSEDPAEFVSAALAPSTVLGVELLDEGRACRVTVPFDQLSLAIGKEGQNARLAAKLTGLKIDIKPDNQ